MDPATRQRLEAARGFLARHGPLIVAVAATVLSPASYLLWATSAVTTALVAASALGYVAVLAYSFVFSPQTRFITMRRRLEAVAGRLFMALLTYIPLGYLLIVLLHVLTPREFPIFDVTIFRYIVAWPFYVWYVLACLVPGWPCPPAPVRPVTPPAT